MPLPPVRVTAVETRASGHDDLVELLRHQESLGAVALVDAASDVVHVIGWVGARRRASAGGAPTVLSPPRITSAPASEHLRALLAADAVVVRTSQQRDVVHGLGVPWYRLFVVPHAVDDAVFRRGGPAARRTDRCRVVLEATGAGDGVATALAAVSTWGAAEVVVIAPNRAATLRREAKRLGMAERFVVVQPSDLAERAWWLRSAHAVVAVPEQGPVSRLTLDAMGCGVPVVATPVDVLEDLVVHGVTGLHVPPGDPVSLVRALRSIVSDPFRLEAFGMAASDRAATRYAPERVGRDLLAVYRRILVGRPGEEPVDDVVVDSATDEGERVDLRDDHERADAATA